MTTLEPRTQIDTSGRENRKTLDFGTRGSSPFRFIVYSTVIQIKNKVKMPPNARSSPLRQRFNPSSGDRNESDDDAATMNLISYKNIKPTEIVIDNIIYDLKSFHHPGGDSVFLFGGNDVTVQYKMIHPYHTSKHLEKMKVVGKVHDAKNE
jgi:cytochrome b involved in lipid metabolism